MRAVVSSLWNEVLENVRKSAPQAARAWFSQLQPGKLTGGVLVVRARNAPQARYLREHCGHYFAQAAQAVTGRLVSVEFQEPAAPPADSPSDRSALTLSLNPAFTFATFVTGPCNRLANAAAMAVAESPGRTYNPLFLYGEPGTGKSHLLHAVCDELSRREAALRLVCISADVFSRELLAADTRGQLDEFRARLRGADALAIDNVDELATRQRSQEELFHTFNALYESQRQIVLAGDRVPAELTGIEPRLASRFAAGLAVRLEIPCAETRLAIVLTKARTAGLDLPEPVAQYLAARNVMDVRELEAALTRLDAHSQMRGVPIDLALARQALGEERGSAVGVPDILKAVADHYSLRPADLQGRGRSRSVARPRQVCMYLARELTDLSLEEIGLHFGGRDHTTVLHASRLIGAERAQDPQLARLLDELGRRLRNGQRGASKLDNSL
jgi:chromosomal replication initiator protein